MRRFKLGLCFSLGCVVALAAGAGAKEAPLRFGQPGSVVTFVAFSADGKTLAYGLWPYPDSRGSFRGVAVVWDRVAGKEVRRINVTPANGALSSDGKKLALRVEDGAVGLWDVTTGKKLLDCMESRKGACPSRLAFLPDGRTLLGCFWRDDVYLWETDTGKVRRRFGKILDGGVEHFFLSGDGRRIVADQRTVKWVKYDPRIHRGLPRGGKINVVEDNRRLWDLRTGKELGLVSQSVHRPSYCGTWGSLSATGGWLEDGFRARVAPDGKVVFCPPPGRLPLAVRVTDNEGTSLVDAATGKEIRRLAEVPKGGVEEVVLSADQRAVAVLTSNTGPPQGTRAFVYDLADLIDKERARVARLSADKLKALWTDLARRDRAPAAMFALAQQPPAALLAFLEGQLPGVTPPGPERLARLLANLDSPTFAVRTRAQAELEALGHEAVPVLREALQAKPSLEKRRRLERLLADLEKRPLSDRIVRGLCFIDLLEQQNSPKARALLESLAGGAAGAWVTAEAKAALARCP
jgi:hypothetical protein